ncbi:threonine-phosphate decarboxylase CobD [bacterium 210820-DFI.6.37]|nr:threonine-phosphate decarboxylase CobD [bacterium 210820-DFI.6.37]
MTELIHGGDVYTAIEKGMEKKKILDYSANINPLGIPQAVVQAAARALEDCGQYPDPLCRKLGARVAEKEQVPRERLVFGNGAADLIFRLTIAEKPKKALVPAPSFAEYEKALAAAGCETVRHLLREEEDFALTERILPSLNEDLDMLFLCNPNNPTGSVIRPELLRKIVLRCEERNIRVVVDECFIDFLKDPERATVKDMTESCKSLFVLRAFTKNYAMPGLRLGYGICKDKELLSRIREAGQPWNVSLVAQEAGAAALGQNEYLEEARQLIFRERERLCRGLSVLGYKVFPPGANYIFFKLEKSEKNYVDSFQEDLAAEGILIRGCGNYEGLGPGFFRIAVRKEEENKRLLEALSRREQVWQKRL